VKLTPSPARQVQKAPLSRLQTLLPSLAPQEDSFEPLIKAHRASILWTLNDRLAKASAGLTDLQEERSRRREERGRSLGGQAAKEAAKLGLGKGSGAGAGGAGWLNGMFNQTTPQLQQHSHNGKGDIPSVIPPDEPPIESQLSAQQLQALESENSALLQNMESTLSSVLAAEKSLLEISSLQTELVKNLVQQTEITDRLYEEAVGSVGEMKKAGQQLTQAKKRGEEGRLFLLIFLFGASMALLFLDWYAS
jgi:syntaxin 18